MSQAAFPPSGAVFVRHSVRTPSLVASTTGTLQAAELFHRTQDGLRVSLSRNTRFSNVLNAAKRLGNAIRGVVEGL